MAYDAVKMADWQISEAAEENMPTPDEWREKLGLQPDEIIPQGRLCRLDFMKIIDRLKDKPDGKYIEVTAITPTPLGEGKSTTSCGLMEGMGKRGVNVGGVLRQPSGGPTMNIKGTAAGGGNSLLIPMTEFSMGLTGDINDIMNAHNLAMVALTARMQHERNYSDEQLERLTRMPRLDIDPTRVEMGWIMDYCAQSLRNIIIGIGGRYDGFMMKSSFGIAVSSELMAILSIVYDLKDLREKLNNITVAFDKSGKPVTTGDLEVGNAMTAWMRNTINPTLMCTAEYQPCMVHAGPFANIAHGCNSVTATTTALKLADYVVTEAGFGADLGAEKFLNIKCRKAGLSPAVVVLVATVRAMKMNGGVAKGDLGLENVAAVQAGCANLGQHIANVQGFGVPVVVAINHFSGDTQAEIDAVTAYVADQGSEAILCRHWSKGSDGTRDLATRVAAIADAGTARFQMLYPDEMPLLDKIETIATRIYRAGGIAADARIRAQLTQWEAQGFGHLPICMAKTQYSFSTDPDLRGAPRGHTVPIREVRLSAGAGFIVAICGDIMTMPGLPRVPAAESIGLNARGEIEGLF